MLFRSYIIILIGLWSLDSYGQNQTDKLDAKKEVVTSLAYPPAMTMPFRAVGIDRLQQSLARQELEKVRSFVDARFLNNSQNLNEYINNRLPLTNNLMKVTGQIMTGSATVSRKEGVYLEPVWCSLMDYYLVFIQISDTKRNLIMSSSHTAIPKNLWDRALKQKGLAALIKNKLIAATTSAIGKVKPYSVTDALAVGFNIGRGLSRADETQAHCLNLLVEEQLADEFKIPRTVGGDKLASVRRALKQPAKLRRPTRTINMQWFLPEGKDVTRILPNSAHLQATYAESVFGRSFKPLHNSDWKMTVKNNQISFPVDETLLSFIRAERDSLKIADKAQVSKINRAWVYLDRGRAWGLKMRDRVVAKVGDKTVKGHVVRFFGPEEGVVSPRGFPVKEGAIVYIRKGQKDTKVGMEFTPDPRQYPTPWPPTKDM
jgi:hypothetical protein